VTSFIEISIRILGYHFLGYSRRSPRNSSKNTIKEFWTRIKWVQKWSYTDHEASALKSCKTSWLLHSRRRENSCLWIHAQHFIFGTFLNQKSFILSLHSSLILIQSSSCLSGMLHSQALTDQTRGKLLDWSKRFSIMYGIAKGLDANPSGI